MAAVIAQYKKDKVKQLVKLLTDNPIVGAVNMENLPAPAVQKMRAKLRGKAEIIMSKRRLINVALKEAEKSKKDLTKLSEKLRGMPALLITKDNPFAIYKTIKQSKSPAPAKAGQIAPKDIEVKAGPTEFLPGPIIGELGSIGIKTGVEGGKLAIKEDAIVAKEGDVIDAKMAGLLTRLGIEPMEIGLDITGIYEDGTIYDRKVLDIDEDQFMADLNQAATWARNLALETAYTTKDTIEFLLAKTFNQSKALALEQNILTDATTDEILAKAERQAQSVKSTAKIEDAPAKEKKKEEPKEEKKEEPEAPKEEAKPSEKEEKPDTPKEPSEEKKE